jgi:hypothetical protein
MTDKPKKRRPAQTKITKADALRRAQCHVLHRLFKGAKVADGATARLGIYIRGNWKPADAWVVYKNPENPMELKSADIIAVSKRTGRVLYEGPAGDEG